MLTVSPAFVRTVALQKLKNRRPAFGSENTGSLPHKEFVIWFSARSGSTWLGSLLFSAGFPKPEEYFHPNKVLRRAAYLGVNSWQEYVETIKRKRSIAGVFGHEMTFQFWDMLRNDGDAMSYLDFSGPSVVLFRENIVLQAVSLYLAMSSGKWHRYHGVQQAHAVAKIIYDESKIRSNVEYLLGLENGLKNNREHLIRNARFISYEHLSNQSGARIIDAFSQYIGFEARADVRASSMYSRMRTTQNLEMSERFLENNRQWFAEARKKRSWIFDAAKSFPLIARND